MLVLTRKERESIVINDVIVVTVVKIAADQVQLSIEAPNHVSVHRREVYEAIRRAGGVSHEHDSPGETAP
jgi:carbon storage regulator